MTTGSHVLIITTTHQTSVSRVQDPPHYAAHVIDMDGNTFHTIVEGVYERHVYQEATRWAQALGFQLLQRTDTIREQRDIGEVTPA